MPYQCKVQYQNEMQILLGKGFITQSACHAAVTDSKLTMRGEELPIRNCVKIDEKYTILRKVELC